MHDLKNFETFLILENVVFKRIPFIGPYGLFSLNLYQVSVNHYLISQEFVDRSHQ